MKNKPKAVVLLSGGLDSATTLFIARAQGFQPRCIIFDYHQRHRKEIACAKSIACAAGCPYKIIKISLPWQGSSLLDGKMALPSARDKACGNAKCIPSTYVPARNIIFLSFALSYAEAIKASAIFIGANAVDYSGYPDCRPQFYHDFNQMIKTGTKSGVSGRAVKIFTPLINKTKAQIIKLGLRLGVPYELTWSCYKGASKPCGICDSCYYRSKGFQQARVKDPLLNGR